MASSLLPSRYYFLVACVLSCAGAVALALWLDQGLWWWPAAATGALSVVGIRDVTQQRQAIRRNYPILSHIRFFLEYIRPEIRQYFLETEHGGGAVLARAALDRLPAGQEPASTSGPSARSSTSTQPQYEWINHSMAPRPIADHDFRITIGNAACTPAVFGQRVQHLGDELRRAVAERDPGAQRRRAPRAASTTTPARARSRASTASRAATWCGKSARATSVAAIPTAASAPSVCRATRRRRRSR